MRVSGILCVIACLTETVSGNNLSQKRLLDKCLIQDPVQGRASVQSKAGLDQRQAIQRWLLLPFPTDTHAFHMSTVQCHGCCPDLQGVEESLTFSVKLGEQAKQMAKWQRLTREDKSFLRADLAKNTDIRQPKLWEISHCIYTSRWFFRHLWQQRKKQNKATKKIFWNPQCSWEWWGRKGQERKLRS